MSMTNKKTLVLYSAVSIIVAACFLVIGTRLNRAAEAQLIDLFSREKVLQTVAVRNAISENLNRLINESYILASYSFPEYEMGTRSRDSMNNLFQIEIESYGDSAAYSYLDFSGDKSISIADDSEQGEAALMIAEQFEAQYRDTLSATTADYIIPPFVTSSDNAYAGLLFPVKAGGEPAGMLTTIIDMNMPIERYINPLEDKASGSPIVLDSNFKILWEPERGSMGMRLSEVYPEMTDSCYEDLRRDISEQNEGAFSPGAEGEDPGSFNLAWSRMELGAQLVIIAIISDENNLYELLVGHKNERIMLYVVMITAVAVLLIGLMRIQLFSLRQAFLVENQKKLERMVDERTAELNNLLKRYTAIFESANDAITLLEGDVFTDCNERTLELFEADSIDDIIGRHPAELSPEVQPDGTPSEEKVETIIRNCLEGHPQCYIWRHKTLKGRTFDAEISISAIYIDDKILVQSIVRDVSERIRAQEEKEVMMKEIHHRVKNNLQIINSFLNLQYAALDQGQAREAVDTAQRRVDAMAKMHELLYANEDLSRISTREYFSEIAGFFIAKEKDPDRPKIKISLENLELEPDRCMYTGFILSELVDNSLKHAFSGDEDFQIIEIKFFKEINDGILEVSDNGRGFDPNVRRSGLGLQLIEALVAQLGGRFEWQFAGGSRAIFRFSLIDV